MMLVLLLEQLLRTRAGNSNKCLENNLIQVNHVTWPGGSFLGSEHYIREFHNAPLEPHNASF